jgi:hypothetical protein
MDVGHPVTRMNDRSLRGGANRNAALHHLEVAKAEICAFVTVVAKRAATIVPVGAAGRMIDVFLNETVRPG